jgi:hypothetical protein
VNWVLQVHSGSCGLPVDAPQNSNCCQSSRSRSDVRRNVCGQASGLVLACTNHRTPCHSDRVRRRPFFEGGHPLIGRKHGSRGFSGGGCVGNYCWYLLGRLLDAANLYILCSMFGMRHLALESFYRRETWPPDYLVPLPLRQ